MSKRVLVLLLAALCCSLAGPAPAENPAARPPRTTTVDFRSQWDDMTPLANPHKGWYHHYPDNGFARYPVRENADLLDFPGMDHLYMRLAWSYLEPAEGRFNWDVIDRIIEKWTAHGLGIAFRISCQESGTDPLQQQYATPRWVIAAGAKGGYFRHGKEVGSDGPWEPVYDDPVFLEKLEQFLQAFAARYDGQPWLRYVDIGSFGVWGEGHCHAGSRRPYGYAERKPHVDLHLKYFTETPLVISDDFVHGVSDPEMRQKLHRYIIENGITYRDDSILVDGYFRGHADSFCVRSPELFADAWRHGPNVFELEHYSAVKRHGNWRPDADSSLARYGRGRTGADMFRGALRLLRATWIGYHGYAHQWLADNPELTGELLNRCGYWYFPQRAQYPETCTPGQRISVEMTWENRGVAPAYVPFQLKLRLDGPQSCEVAQSAGNRKWLPADVEAAATESYALAIPAKMKPGTYDLRFKLFSPAADRDVAVALKPSLLDKVGYYRIGQLRVE